MKSRFFGWCLVCLGIIILILMTGCSSESRKRKFVADNPNTSPRVLEELSAHYDKYVRMRVAGNPSTPVEILAELSKDPDEWVRRYVARNPNTPPDILTELSKDPSEYVRESVAENSNTPPEILPELISKDLDKQIERGPQAFLLGLGVIILILSIVFYSAFE